MFSEKAKELYHQLEKTKHMVVSTSWQDKVTSRTLSTIYKDGKLYFQTDRDFITTKQLKENTNIALCSNNIQITGVAKIIGTTLENKELAKLYKEKHESSYESYSSLPTTVMMEVTIDTVTMWVYRDKMPYICQYDMATQEYTEKQYL